MTTATDERPVRAAPPRPRRRSRAWVVAALAVLVAAAAASLVAGRDDPADLGGTITALDGPIELRSQAATVALGDGSVLIWGGRGLTADSAERFDPRTGTWEHLPAPPGPARFSAAATWTGSEAFIWGGSLSSTELFVLDEGGIAWNPATRTWRELPPAPIGLMDARAVAFPHGVLITGGRQLTDAAPVDLWFDLDQRTWREIPSPVSVLSTTTFRGHLVGVGPRPDRVGGGTTSTWSVVTFDEVALAWSHDQPDLVTTWAALAPDGDTLTAVTLDDGQLHGRALADGAWRDTGAAAPGGALSTIEPRGYPPVAAWTGDRLLLGGTGGLTAWVPGARRFEATTDRVVHTFGGTAVWTGTELVALSSQSSEGWIWTPPPAATADR